MSGHGRVIAGAVIEKGGFDWGNGNFPLYDKPDTSYGGMRWGHDLGDLGNVAYSLRLENSSFEKSWCKYVSRYCF